MFLIHLLGTSCQTDLISDELTRAVVIHSQTSRYSCHHVCQTISEYI